jgi:hypothetical protein
MRVKNVVFRYEQSFYDSLKRCDCYKQVNISSKTHLACHFKAEFRRGFIVLVFFIFRSLPNYSWLWFTYIFRVFPIRCCAFLWCVKNSLCCPRCRQESIYTAVQVLRVCHEVKVLGCAPTSSIHSDESSNLQAYHRVYKLEFHNIQRRHVWCSWFLSIICLKYSFLY